MNALPPWRSAAPDAPLRMPPQALDAGRLLPAAAPPGARRNRALLALGAALPTAGGAWALGAAVGADGWQWPDLLLLPLFVVLLGRISLGAASFLLGLRRGPPAPAPAPLRGRFALLLPAHNEDTARLAALLHATRESLDAAGIGAHFDLFLLSDSTDPRCQAREETLAAALRARFPGGVFHRRRAANHGRKAGNVADWVRRHGAAYEGFVVLDADSVMEAPTLHALAAALEADPAAGLVQSVPTLVNARTRLARMQAWAARAHGPALARGIAAWAGEAGNYWGHNAAIRTRAFAAAAGLPELPGRAPFGGTVLSHDFVEAALLRRAGWAVRLRPEIGGSHEEGPPTLAALDARDRRWCQGNLQHLRLLATPGLHPVSRLHLLDGALGYLAAPLWLLLVLAGAAGAAMGLAAPGPGPFLLALALLLLPRLAGFRRDPHGALAEAAISTLMAPVQMVTHSRQVADILAGRDSGWRAQGREGEVPPWDAAWRSHGPHAAAGAALVLFALLTPAALGWLLPLALPLLLAPALVRWLADPAGGQGFRTPEDAAPSALRRRIAALRDTWAARLDAAEATLERRRAA